MSTHTEQDVLNLAADYKAYRMAAQNAAIAKGYDSSYFDTDTKKLSDISNALLRYYPGLKDAWGARAVTVATNHAADIKVINKAAPVSVNAVDNATSFSPSTVGYNVAEQDIHVTYPTARNLANAPACFRLQITLPSGIRRYVWALDPA